MCTWTLIVSLLLSSVALVAIILIPAYKPSDSTDDFDDIHTIPAELDVDIATASLECSHNGKPWYICATPSSGVALYCPAYSEFNESEVAQNEWTRTTPGIGVSTPLSPCFTCPGPESNCTAVVNDEFNTTSRLQNQTTNGAYIYDLALSQCNLLCNSSKQGDICGLNAQCTVS